MLIETQELLVYTRDIVFRLLTSLTIQKNNLSEYITTEIVRSLSCSNQNIHAIL